MTTEQYEFTEHLPGRQRQSSKAFGLALIANPGFWAVWIGQPTSTYMVTRTLNKRHEQSGKFEARIRGEQGFIRFTPHVVEMPA